MTAMTEEKMSGSTAPVSPKAADAGVRYDWGAMAIHPFAGWGFIAGVLALVLSGFLTTLLFTAENAGSGLVRTTLWFSWIGVALISSSLIFGALVSAASRPGIRVAMVAIGLFVLLAMGRSPTGAMPRMF